MQSPTVGPPSSSQTDESPTSILNPSANSGSASTLDNQKGRTIDDIFDAIGFGWFQIRLLWIVGVSFSCDVIEITLLVFIQGCVTDEWNLSSSTESLLTSAVFAGEILGMLVMGPFADSYGRKASILLGWFLIIVFGLISCVSPNIFYLVLTRMLVGVGIGSSQSVAYDYFAETVPTKDRNKIGYISFFSVSGSLFVILSGFLLLSTYGWRWMTFACTMPMTFVAIAGFFYLTESSRWLASQGRYLEAEVLLNSVAVINGKEEEIGDIIILQNKDMEKTCCTYADLLEEPFLGQTLLLWAVWLCAYFAHYCIFIIFVTYFSTGNCSFKFQYLALGSGLQLFGILSATQAMNYIGRINSVILYFALAGVFMLIYGFVAAVSGPSDAAISMLFLAQICTTSGTSVMWVLTVELFPTELRATGHSSCCIIGRIGAFAAVYWIDDYSILPGNTLAGSFLYISTAIATAFLISFLPETTGVKLDQISPQNNSSVVRSDEDTPVSLEKGAEHQSLLGKMNKII